MYQFLIVAIMSYIIGSLFKIGDGNRKYSLEFAKGFLTLLMSGFYLHSGLSYLMASAGILAGQSRPVFSRVNGYSAEVVSLGIIFYMSPVMGIVLALLFIVLKKVLKGETSNFILEGINTKDRNSEEYNFS